MADETKKPELTRIKVRHLYFRENVDVPGGSQISNLRGYAEPPQNPNYWTIDYIPAWGAFEISWKRHQVPDTVRLMPAVHVLTWEKG